jgi:hypothetical protein
LTGASLDTLKLSAMIFMAVAHFNQIYLDDADPWIFYLGFGVFPMFAFVMACHLYRQTPLESYLQRLVVFALLSEPIFVLTFYEAQLNILFTFALAAVVAPWIVEQAPWRRHMLFGLSLSSVFIEDAIDYDLLGIVLPAAFFSAMRGQRFAIPWVLVILMSLNLDVGDIVSLESDGIILNDISMDLVLTFSGTIVFPWVIYALCRRLTGDRFLPRYTLYWFYPGHLLPFAIWRWLQGGPFVEVLAL